MNESYGVEVVEISRFGRYIMRTTENSPYSTLETANRYSEHPLTIWSQPDFYLNPRPESPGTIQDEFFANQWYLQNSGQGGGTSGVDINVVPAWAITDGSPDIVVAVIDIGVANHEDFRLGQVSNGFTAGGNISTTGAPPASGEGNAHGQAVAGIIGAAHNEIGVRGITNGIHIMPIRVIGLSVQLSEMADAIDTAWVRGADILNNSWGLGDSEEYYDHDIADALQRAITIGRNGSGSLVIKSAGNNGNFVTFPGNVPGVFVVGAITNSNQHASYSSRGNIDVVAPSNTNFFTPTVITTDLMGNQGYNAQGNYANVILP